MEQQGSSGFGVLTRKQIFDRIQAQDASCFDQKANVVENQLISSENYNEDQINDLKHKFSYVKSEMKRRWRDANYTEERFLTKNAQWLQGTFEIPRVSTTPGRPSKCFEKSSERTKRRKTEALHGVDLNTLTFATGSKLNSEGKRVASQLLKEFDTSPKRAMKYKKAFDKKDNSNILSPFEALKMIVEADLTRRQYEIIRATNKHLYPCYTLIQKAKKESYPDKDAYRITETSAELDLHALLIQKINSHYLK